MIGNAHIDPVWLWQWPEGYQEVRATFRSALDRMDEYPELRVHHALRLLLRSGSRSRDPELFERIRARIAEGRWQVVGGWWIEPDCNIPVRRVVRAAGALRAALPARPLRHHRDDGRERRLVRPQRDDPAAPARSGMDSYVFLRPGPQERELPGPLFRWESPDGSRVLAYRIPHEYCAPRGDLGEHVEQAARAAAGGRPELMVFYGVGNHGGGPTKANLDSIQRLERAWRPAAARAAARCARFFDARRPRTASCRSSRGELQHHAPGCYTAHSGIKRWNRRAENLLLRAEKWCAVADVARRAAVPGRALERPGSCCSSTSSTTRSPARRSSPPTRTRATSSATPRRSRRVASTAPCSRSRARSTSRPRRTCTGRRLQPAPLAGSRRRRARVHVAARSRGARRRRRGRRRRRCS